MKLAWHDVQAWGVEGRGWSDTERYFDRLPARAHGVVRDVVWDLSRYTTGMMVRFETAALEVWARWTVMIAGRTMTQTPATAVNGLDLYAQEPDGTWRWVSVGTPAAEATTEMAILPDVDPGSRTYAIYLPLFNGIESLEIGVPEGAQFRPVAPRNDRPIAVYGTSICHGAGASRAGMTHISILGRRLNRPMLNLGFSGQGKMDPEVGDLLAELDPCAYVIDCLPNMEGDLVTERFAPLIATLRRARPETPILVVEDRTYAGSHLRPTRRERNVTSRAALRVVYDQVLGAGVTGLHYVPGEPLLGDDGEATVDGSHPTDLGYVRMADALEPVLRQALGAG